MLRAEELKNKIADCRKQLFDLGSMEQGRDSFLQAIRRFMEMGTLTAPLLQELIDHVDVYETEGKGKHRTQRVVIYYRFVGYIDLSEADFEDALLQQENHRAETRRTCPRSPSKCIVRQKKPQPEITHNKNAAPKDGRP